MQADLDARCLRTGLADAGAAAISAKLNQIPRLLERADLEIARAEAALLQFEVVVAERAAARAAEREAAAADAERRRRAQAAADAAFAAAMAEDAAATQKPASAHRKAGSKAK